MSGWKCDIDALDHWWEPATIIPGSGPEVSRTTDEDDPTIQPPHVIGFGCKLPGRDA